MVDPKSKVVPLKPARPPAALPQALLRLHECMGPALQAPLQALFDQADDALFELADRAGSNAEQNLFFESMRELRIRRRGIEQALVHQLQDGIATLVQAVMPGPRDALLDDAVASELSLVDHEELEEMVAVDAMVARAERQFAEALQLLTLRLDAVAPSRKLALRDNPLAPAALCTAFISACRTLEMDIKARLVLFKLFERVVVNALAGFYDQCNKVLEECGVLPGLRNPDLRRKQRATSPAASTRSTGDTHGASVEEEQLFQQLSNLLHQARGPQTVSAGPAGAQQALPQSTLLQLLGQVQSGQLSQIEQVAQGSSGSLQLDVLAALQPLIQARSPRQNVSIGQADDDAINLVSMLFQFILEDRNLAAPLKGLIARLQIPILKVAMLDKSFFGKGGHPARKLLNEMATAGIGWAPGADIERDPLYRKMAAVVDRVLNEFDHDVIIFTEFLADFVSFMEQERRRANLVEQRTVDAEDGRARSEMARNTVQQALNERVEGLTLPAVVARLLQDGWSHVLFLSCLREGEGSEEWRQGLATVDELLESIRPVTDAEGRRRLMQRLPGLLRQLRGGLTRVGFNPYDMNQLFAELEHIHLAILRQGGAATPEPASASMVAEAPAGAVEPSAATVAPPGPLTLDQVLDARLEHSPSPSESGHDAAEMGHKELEPEPLSAEEPSAAIEDLDRELSLAFGDPAEASIPAVAANEGIPGEQPAESGDTAETSAPTASAAALANIDNLRIGSWVEFPGPESTVLRCRLAAVIRATGRYIFVNRAGVKVAESAREQLALDLDTGVLKLLDDSRLFDRALESVIGNLRQMRGEPRV